MITIVTENRRIGWDDAGPNPEATSRLDTSRTRSRLDDPAIPELRHSYRQRDGMDVAHPDVALLHQVS
ncbi:hypothetical protein [Pantoea sp.]|uniref:hypothetical protein n=1 Tax=Pantoea sp. TaxID=69393 RepID=UPI0029159CD6|nr:hypothetical protein [Pantoea sp.]MDU4128455.1 hypothetical protein [Pantoea sp.]